MSTCLRLQIVIRYATFVRIVGHPDTKTLDTAVSE